jgi:hypothetical protein
MELRRSSKFGRSPGCSVTENVLKYCANALAELELRATLQLDFSKRRPQILDYFCLPPASSFPPREISSVNKTNLVMIDSPSKKPLTCQGCQIFLGTTYQTGEKCTKWPQNICLRSSMFAAKRMIQFWVKLVNR